MEGISFLNEIIDDVGLIQIDVVSKLFYNLLLLNSKLTLTPFVLYSNFLPECWDIIPMIVIIR